MSTLRLVSEPFAFPNPVGDTIQGNIRYHDDGRRKPIIIVCHSFMAFKDWGFFPYIAVKLAEAGFVSIVFNFSFNGVVGANEKITDIDKFSRNTFSKELSDLNILVDAVDKGRIAHDAGDGNSIGLLGHSRGGGIAIIHAASDERIQALVTWSAISTFDRWTSHQKAQWRARGYLSLSKDLHVSPLKLGLEILEDVEQHSEELNILHAASVVNVPWLIIHGSQDITVKPHEAEQLHEASRRHTTELRMMEHIGHLYNASSRAEDGYATLDEILQLTVQWFSRHLVKEQS